MVASYELPNQSVKWSWLTASPLLQTLGMGMNLDITPIERPIKMFFVAFAVALAGVVAGFIMDYQADNILAYVVFWVVAGAILVGFSAVLWCAFAIVRNKNRHR